VEEPLELAAAIAARSGPRTLLVVDCLTLWLTNLLMPAVGADKAASWGDPDDPRFQPEARPRASAQALAAAQADQLVAAIAAASGPVVCVGNEIGLGVIPMGREVRAFVDALGLLNQQVAAACPRVTLMAAGLPLTLKHPD
ncbi:MAG: hypothetical protein EOO25_17845, partial [Comamonadaceae bacterium]